MLRHLGAAYYQTLRGRRPAADAARAGLPVTATEARPRASDAHPGGQSAAAGAGAHARHPRRWRVWTA